MKKLVIAALAIGAMAACTKTNVEFDQPGEISFQPVAQKATKVTSTSIEYPVDGEFNVWAWWGNVNAGTTEVSQFTTQYINEGKFVNRTGATWGGETPYYWPTTGSLFFAGYSPADATGTKAYDLQNQTLTITDYTQETDITKTHDLMWFDVTDQSYDQNVADKNGVPVTFKHALSWLTFKFKLKDNDTAENWVVTNVELTGIETNATFSATKGDNGSVTWSEPEITASSMNVYESATGHNVTYTAKGKTLEGSGVGSVKQGGVLVIPQSCAKTDASLVITYNLKNPAYVAPQAGETPANPEYLEDQQVTLPLNGKDITNDKWEQGKHYIYTIVFGANEILIAPEVAEWEDVTVEVPVE